VGGRLQSGADVHVVLGERAHVPWSFVVVNDFFVVETGECWCQPDIPCNTESTSPKHHDCGREYDGERQSGWDGVEAKSRCQSLKT
jgi:hypothetical protein